MDEVTTFTQKVRVAGASLEITIDHKAAMYEGIEKGDMVKVMIRKLPKKED